MHAIKFTALNIKRETAHKKAEPPIDPEKTQSTPSSLALQPLFNRGSSEKSCLAHGGVE